MTDKQKPNQKTIDPLLRLNKILAPDGPIPVSKSTWWNKVRSGEYPRPIKASSRVTCWKESDIHALIARFEEKGV